MTKKFNVWMLRNKSTNISNSHIVNTVVKQQYLPVCLTFNSNTYLYVSPLTALVTDVWNSSRPPYKATQFATRGSALS
jgi:hypothetical protein